MKMELNFKNKKAMNKLFVQTFLEMKKKDKRVNSDSFGFSFDDSILEILDEDFKITFSTGYYETMQFATLIFKGESVVCVNIAQDSSCKKLLKIYKNFRAENKDKNWTTPVIFANCSLKWAA